MASQKHVKEWLELVKIARHEHIKMRKIKENYNIAHDEIRKSISIYDAPNTDMDKDLGIKWCEIKYCPESWNGALLENDPHTQVHHCQNFSNEKCSIDCPVQSANHKFIEVRDAYDAAKKSHKNSLRRVFGLRIK